MLRDEFLKAIDTGISIATFAKRIGRDPATLYKWVNGTRNLSTKVQKEVYNELLNLKNIWNNIDLETGE